MGWCTAGGGWTAPTPAIALAVGGETPPAAKTRGEKAVAAVGEDRLVRCVGGRGPGLGLRAVVGRWMAGSVVRVRLGGTEEARRTTEGICISTAGSSPVVVFVVVVSGLLRGERLSVAEAVVKAERAVFFGGVGIGGGLMVIECVVVE